MARKSFWFPSKTGHYETKAGNLRFEIQNDSASSATDIDSNCNVYDIKPIEIPFTLITAGDYALSRVQVELKNDDSFFDNYDVFNDDYLKHTLFIVYKDNVAFWVGVIDFDSIRKDDYYLDGSALKYRRVNFTARDPIFYHSINAKTIADVSYSDGMTLYSLMSNIATAVYSGIQVYFDSNLKITEPSGTTYALKDLKLSGLDTSMTIMEFMKDVSYSFGLYSYYLLGYYRFVKLSTGTVSAIDSDNVSRLKKKRRNIEYYKLSATRNWNPEIGFDYEQTDTHTKGNSSVDDNKKIEIESTVAGCLYASSAGSGTITHMPDSGNDHYCKLTDDTDVLGDGYEVGDYIMYNLDGAVYQSRGIITDLDSAYNSGTGKWESEIWFYPGDTIDTSSQIGLVKETKRFKMHLLITQLAASSADTFYFTEKELINCIVKDVDKFIYLQNRFSLLGKNYKVAGLTLDLRRDKSIVKLAEVL